MLLWQSRHEVCLMFLLNFALHFCSCFDQVTLHPAQQVLKKSKLTKLNKQAIFRVKHDWVQKSRGKKSLFKIKKAQGGTQRKKHKRLEFTKNKNSHQEQTR